MTDKRLILFRHGNTFERGDKVVMVGRTADPPLTAEGRAQLKAWTPASRLFEGTPKAIYCATLRRTTQSADILAETFGLGSPRVDGRLTELDYGSWAGLSDAEIADRFGDAELHAWREHAQWPIHAKFGGTEQEVVASVQSFARDVLNQADPGSTVMAVSSNGILRYFLKLVPGLFESKAREGTLKVGTGRACGFREHEGRFELLFWNSGPG